MAVQPIPKGYHSVTPYLVVPDASKELEFLKKAFGAVETEKHLMGSRVMHAAVKIGDSMVMMGEAMGGAQKPLQAGVYLYVKNVDETYQKALQAGAKSINAPADQFYGDRSGGVTDPNGNIWWLGTHIEDVSPEEMKKRSEEFNKKMLAGAKK